MAPNSFRYVGDTSDFRTAEKPELHGRKHFGFIIGDFDWQSVMMECIN